MVNRKHPDHPVWFLFIPLDMTREIIQGVDDKCCFGVQLCHLPWADLGPMT